MNKLKTTMMFPPGGFFPTKKNNPKVAGTFKNNNTAFAYTNERANNLSDVMAELLSQFEILNRSAQISISDLRGNIIHANELFCEASKYTIDELLHNPYSMLWHPDTPSSLIIDMWKKLSSGLVWKGEMKNIAKDGSLFWVQCTIAPQKGADGTPQRYISVRHDITAQKEAEEKLKEANQQIDFGLIENVTYAKQIHGAFLNDREDIENIHNDAFLIYKAQKIISGDFYKVEKRDGKLVFIIGDSAGHGVSASYISILLLNMLTRILQRSDSDPAQILNRLNRELNSITHAEGKKHLTESADVMACFLDMENMKLQYASARIKAFIIRNGEVIVLQKDRCSIGESIEKAFKINNHSFDLEKGDSLYVFSDGLTDQFGGPADKRIGLTKITALIADLQQHPMKTQKKMIEEALAGWRQANEQTDDITLFGIKI